MFKAKLLSLFGGLCLAGSSLAWSQGPVVCPSINAAKAEGMTQAAEIMEGMYLTYHQSKFDTPTRWIFIMGPVIAEDEDVALTESNTFLASMSGTAEPQEDEDGNWVCEYDTTGHEGPEDFAVLAIQADNPIPAFKLYQRLHP